MKRLTPRRQAIKYNPIKYNPKDNLDFWQVRLLRLQCRYSSLSGSEDLMATELTNDVAEARPDLLWDDEVPGLCVRVHGNGSKSFVFVYRIKDRQRFTRIGHAPKWSLKAARIRAKELRWILDQGGDPASEKHEPKDAKPVEELMQYIAENTPITSDNEPGEPNDARPT